MKKSQKYYYEDMLFQLELNLQDVRRDLVELLEGYKFNDCFACDRIKCCCSIDNSFRSTTLSVDSTSNDSALPEEISLDMYNAAPPADTLPTPRWPENTTRNVNVNTSPEKPSPTSLASLNIWIRASIPNIALSNTRVTFPVPGKVLDHVNYSWPPFPKSIWSDETLKETVAREHILNSGRESDGNSSVQAFFRHFSGSKAAPKASCAW